MDPPIVGVLGGWLLSANVSQNRVDEYVQLLPLKGPNGDQLYHKNTPSTVIRHYFLLSAKTEYPEVAVRWINECYGEDMSIQMIFGNYGEQIEKLPDGSIKFLDPPEGMARGPWTWTNALVSNSPAAIYAEWQDRFEASPWLPTLCCSQISILVAPKQSVPLAPFLCRALLGGLYGEIHGVFLVGYAVERDKFDILGLVPAEVLSRPHGPHSFVVRPEYCFWIVYVSI
jgi:hypothetical protein